MTYVYIIYKLVENDRPLFAGAWESFEEAEKWKGTRDDVQIAQVSFVPKSVYG